MKKQSQAVEDHNDGAAFVADHTKGGEDPHMEWRLVVYVSLSCVVLGTLSPRIKFD